jgi:hypothetical protein
VDTSGFVQQFLIDMFIFVYLFVCGSQEMVLSLMHGMVVTNDPWLLTLDSTSWKYFLDSIAQWLHNHRNMFYNFPPSLLFRVILLWVCGRHSLSLGNDTSAQNFQSLDASHSNEALSWKVQNFPLWATAESSLVEILRQVGSPSTVVDDTIVSAMSRFFARIQVALVF